MPAMPCLIRIAFIGGVEEIRNPGARNERDQVRVVKTTEAVASNFSSQWFRLNEYFGKKNRSAEFYTESVPHLAYLLQ